MSYARRVFPLSHMTPLRYACLLELLFLRVASDPLVDTCSSEACRSQELETDQFIMLTTRRSMGKHAFDITQQPRRSALEQSEEKVTLKTLVGKWSSSHEPAMRIEIETDGIVHYDQQHWKEFDIHENGGVVERNDGWKVDATKSTTNSLVWTKDGEPHFEWSRTKVTQEKVTLKTIVGKWTSSGRSTRGIEIKADGIVFYDQKHWKEFDLHEDDGVVQRNDGWKLDTTKSDADKLVWSKDDKGYLEWFEWSRTQALITPAKESSYGLMTVITALFGSAQPQFAVPAGVNKVVHIEGSLGGQQALVATVAQPVIARSWIVWMLVPFCMIPLALCIVALADAKHNSHHDVQHLRPTRFAPSSHLELSEPNRPYPGERYDVMGDL